MIIKSLLLYFPFRKIEENAINTNFINIALFSDLWSDSWMNITIASIGLVMASNLAFRMEVLLLWGMFV